MLTLDVGLSVYEAHRSELLELPREPLLRRVVLALTRHRHHHLSIVSL